MIQWIKNLFKGEEPNYCVDCKYCDRFLNCKSPQNKKPDWEDVVTGKMVKGLYRNRTCRENRNRGVYISDSCGPKARWFEPIKAEFNLKPCQLEPTTNPDAVIRKSE